MNRMYLKFNESKEAIETIKYLLENNVRHEGANKIDFYNNFQNQPVFIRLKEDDGVTTFEISRVKFSSPFKNINDFENLLNEKKQLLINFKEYEYNNFNNNIEIYTKEYKLNKQREDIIGYIQFQLESNGFQIEKPLIYRGDKSLLLNGKEVNFLEFLEQTDCVELLDYALKNQTFLNKVDVEQITFDKAKKCNEILKEFKLELEKNKDFNIEEVDDISF